MSGSFLAGPREAERGGQGGSLDLPPFIRGKRGIFPSVNWRCSLKGDNRRSNLKNISQMWIATPQRIHPHPNPLPLEERDHSPSPRPSPLKGEGDFGQGLPKGEGDYGRGLLEARLAMTHFFIFSSLHPRPWSLLIALRLVACGFFFTQTLRHLFLEALWRKIAGN